VASPHLQQNSTRWFSPFPGQKDKKGGKLTVIMLNPVDMNSSESWLLGPGKLSLDLCLTDKKIDAQHTR